MRLAIAGAALVLLSLAPAFARAAPAVHGAATVGLGMRGNQGGVMDGGFRLLITAGLSIGKRTLIVELDRQIGPDARIEDGDGDQAQWYEWVAAARTGRRFTLVRGLALVGTGGVALVHATITGPIDGSRPSGEITRWNLGLDAGAALLWQSESLVVILGAAATIVPFPQQIRSGGLDLDLPARIEPSATLGIGFVY